MSNRNAEAQSLEDNRAVTLRACAAVLEVTEAIVQAIQAAGKHGVSGGILYSALMAFGCDMSQFERFMTYLTSRGKIAKRGDFYYATGGQN